MNKLYSSLRLIGSLILVLASKSFVIAATPDTLNGASIEYEYAFEEAIKQCNFGNYAQSLYLFKKCLEVNSHSVASYYQISNIYLLAGDSKAALNYARSAYLFDISNKWSSLLLIKCYQLIDRNDSALVILERLMKLNFENLDLKYEYGNLLSNNGKLDEAIKCFNEIDKKIGVNEGTALARHQIYLQKHDFEHAISELNTLINAFPDEIRYLGMLAELYSSIHKSDKAKAIYEKIFKIDSTNNLALISIADFYRDIKDYEKSFVQLDKVLAKPEIQLESKMGVIIGYIRNDSDLILNKDRIRNKIGKLALDYPGDVKVEKLLVDYFIRTNSFDSAISLIDRFIDKEDNQEIWEQYFLLLNARYKYETILLKFSQAKNHAGNITGIYIIAGIANIQLKKYYEAVGILNDGLEIKSIKNIDKIEMLKYKGEALFKLGQSKLSDSCFEEVIKINPLDYLVLNNYSFYLALRDTLLKKAKAMSRKVIKRYPENATYLDTYAFILIKMHRYNAAYRYMVKAIIYNENGDSEIFEHMGDILFIKGKRQEAIEYWTKAKAKSRTEINIDDKIKSFGK
jgi:tetratricopeptide (TPR) repeat protein